MRPREEYVLVMFEDDTISIIPKRNILDEVVVHQTCTVKWTGRKQYQAEVLFVGMYGQVQNNALVNKY